MRRHADNNVFFLWHSQEIWKRRRLQNILATGKDEVEDEVVQVFVRKKEEEIAEPDRFEECTSSCPQEGGRQLGSQLPPRTRVAGCVASNLKPITGGAKKPSFQEKGLTAVIL